MEVTFLLGSIFSPIASVLGLIMNGIYAFFHLFNIQNIALSIFVFTFIMKMLMLPLTMKQQKFTRLSSRMNPEIQKIQAKYKGKKDEASLRKQQAETQAIYQKYGASPTSGCLPLLIMLPIMFALYEVINNIPNYVTLVRNQYQIVADAVLANNLTAEVVANVKNINVDVATLTDSSKIIDILAKFTAGNWTDLLAKLTGPAVEAINYIKNVNTFFGLSITNNPDWKSISVIIPILAMSLQFIQSKQLQVKNNDTKNDNPTASAMNSMNVVMPIMSGFFCLMLPIGVGLYWIANSLFSIVQQFFVNKYLDNIGMDELVEKSSAKASKKFAAKSTTGSSLQDLARKQTKNIESTANVKKEEENITATTVSEVDTNSDDSSEYKPTSISEIANLLKNRNEKGDK